MNKKCPICSSDDTVFLTEYVAGAHDTDRIYDNMNIRMCSKCQAAFGDPIPKKEILKQYYSTAYRSNGKNTTSGNNFPLDNLWYLSRGISIAKLAHGFISSKGGAIMHADIGAGYGHVIASFKTIKEWDVNSTAVEPNIYCHDSLAKIADSIETSFDESSESHVSKFDLITLLHVLEHVPAPVAVLRSIGKKLKPGGLLILEVPHCPVDRTVAFDRKLPHAPHLFFFTLKCLKTTLQRSGFHILHISSYGPELKKGYQYDTVSTADQDFNPPPEAWLNNGQRLEFESLNPPFPVFSVNGTKRCFLRAVAQNIMRSTLGTAHVSTSSKN